MRDRLVCVSNYHKPTSVSKKKGLAKGSLESQRNEDGLLCNENGAIWASNFDAGLQLRHCVTARTGPSGHRSATTTSRALRQHYTWSTLAEDVSTFLKACMRCLSTIVGRKVLRPKGLAAYSTKPNNLFLFD